MACKYYEDCEHQSGWCKSGSMLVKCNYGLNRLYDEQIIKIADLEDENKKLKQQLEAENIELAERLTDEEVFQYGCMLGDAHKKISELKRLLKFAVGDIARYCCDVCKYRNIDAYLYPCNDCFCVDAFKWRFADEVKELLEDV